MSCAGDVDDPRGTGDTVGSPGSGLVLVQEQVSEEEMPKMVRTELQLNVLFRKLLLRDHDAGVVDEDVDRVEEGGDLRSGFLDGFLGCKVEFEEFDRDIW